MSSSPSKGFVGPLQPTRSRLPISRVWSRTTRPGPAEYSQPGSMGVQPNSLKPSTTGFAFGGEKKDNFGLVPSHSDQHLFDAEQSMGKQVTSLRPTQPRAHLGTSTRDHSAIMHTAHTYKPQ